LNRPSYTTLNSNDCGGTWTRFVRESRSPDGSTGVITGLAPAAISFPTSDLEGLNVRTGSRVTTIFGIDANRRVAGAGEMNRPARSHW
jgi:hypothetical protein